MSTDPFDIALLVFILAAVLGLIIVAGVSAERSENRGRRS